MSIPPFVPDSLSPRSYSILAPFVSLAASPSVSVSLLQSASPIRSKISGSLLVLITLYIYPRPFSFLISGSCSTLSSTADSSSIVLSLSLRLRLFGGGSVSSFLNWITIVISYIRGDDLVGSSTRNIAIASITFGALVALYDTLRGLFSLNLVASIISSKSGISSIGYASRSTRSTRLIKKLTSKREASSALRSTSVKLSGTVRISSTSSSTYLSFLALRLYLGTKRYV